MEFLVATAVTVGVCGIIESVKKTCKTIIHKDAEKKHGNS